MANLGGLNGDYKGNLDANRRIAIQYNISYTTNVTNDDKHIQINLTIPNYYENKTIKGEEK